MKRRASASAAAAKKGKNTRQNSEGKDGANREIRRRPTSAAEKALTQEVVKQALEVKRAGPYLIGELL